MGNKMEGDIAVENLKKFVADSNRLGRNAIRQAYRRWPNKEIPYSLSNQYGSYARSVIAKAMQEYHDKTCVRFVPRDPARHVDYIFIHPDDGCYSLVGKQDRDDYIEIVWRNVQNGADDQFEKYNMNVIDHLNEPYDYSSIMHYGPYAFSGSGKKTILPRKGGAERMGQRVAFSEGDVRKINKLYQCSEKINGNSITDTEQVWQFFIRGTCDFLFR
ncbi:unnamed protein product [Nippostrongylus brasiliensis]|uniref:Metalloendopeptidase n=1 Tax=Nippostrongylus brasiliensis TaxID=27835 RepID=A0A0N4YKT5_NIPBR|nr:unnamed protein product [Nippostrongylus brasiliensis]VDL83722.1 unnamed protein product [Nippostrongylus brasiliensis]